MKEGNEFRGNGEGRRKENPTLYQWVKKAEEEKLKTKKPKNTAAEKASEEKPINWTNPAPTVPQPSGMCKQVKFYY